MSGGGKPTKPATRLVEAGRRSEWTGAVVNPPIWRGSTHLYADSADLARGRPNEDGHFYYGRRGSPTQWALADALSAANRDADATEVEQLLAATGPVNDPRSYSLFLATRGRDPDVALRLAEEELKIRRDVYTLDALAWAQSAKGDAAEAWKTMRSALASGAADARLYLHAAAIAAQAGENRQAKIYAGKAARFASSLLPSERTWLKRLKVV